MPKSFSLSSAITFCRSSRFLPLTRSWSPCTWCCTPLSVEALDVLADLAGLLVADADVERDRLAHGSLRRLPRPCRSRAAFSDTLRLTSFSSSTWVSALRRWSLAVASSIDFSLRSIDAVGALEVEPRRDLARRLVDRVADLLDVHLGDDVEGGHGGVDTPDSGEKTAANVRPGPYPSGQRGRAVNLLRKLRWFESIPGPPYPVGGPRAERSSSALRASAA